MNPAGTSGINAAGRNAVITSLMVWCGYVVCFTPFHLLVAINFTPGIVQFGSWYHHLTVVLMLSNSCINPFIYGAKYREFQQGARRLLSKLRLNQQQWHPSAVT